MVLSYAPNESSLGLRVRNLINADLSNCAQMIVDNMQGIITDEYSKQLNYASSKYIVMLENIQSKNF